MRKFVIDIDSTEYDKLGITAMFDGDIETLRRNLAKKFHPDTGGEPNATRMKEINNACDILGDREERKAYDDALRHERGNARTRPAEEAKRERQHRGTSPPPPPRPPPPPAAALRPPSLSMRMWFVPAFIPVIGPVVSWTYAAITAASRQFARWALLYGALLAFAIVASATSSQSSGGASSLGAEVITAALILLWVFGPMVQALRRRREVIDAMRQGGVGPDDGLECSRG